MFRMLCAFDVSPPFSLLAVLLLVSTRSFFFASHAARLDVASGLSVLAFTWYLSDRYERLIQSRWHPTRRWLFIYGAIAMLFATLSIHLLTLLGLLSIYMLWRFGSLRRPSYLLFAMAGVVVMAGVLVAVYAMSGAPWTLFGASAKPNQFQSVAGMLPIERPFSRSVQVANILERFSGLWSEAPAFLILILIWVGTLLFKRQAASCQPRRSFLLGASGTVLVAWLLFESPALYYYVHILPLFIVAMIADIYARLQVGKMLTSRIALLAVPLAYFGISDASRAAHVSQRIAHDNRAALEQVVRYVTSESHEGSHSVILAQNPAIAYLEADRNVRLMTAHIVSFPLTDQPIATALRNLGVRYILLYAAHDGSIYSEDYRMLRPVADSIGTIVFKQTGVLFDVHRDYFASSKVALASDTLLLYKLSDTLVR
jgi:hypothetical protein